MSFTSTFFAYFKFYSDWGRVTGKIKQNELDCRDTVPSIRVSLCTVNSFIFSVAFKPSRRMKSSFTTRNRTLFFSLVFGFATGNAQEPTGVTLVPFQMTSVCEHESNSSPSAYFRDKIFALAPQSTWNYTVCSLTNILAYTALPLKACALTTLTSSNSSSLSILWTGTFLHFLAKRLFSLDSLHFFPHAGRIFLSGWCS